MYRTFILSFKYLSIYIKKRTILKGYQEPSCLEHYFENAKNGIKVKIKTMKQ